MDTFPPFSPAFNLPEGQEQQFVLPLPGIRGTARVVATGEVVLNETRFLTEQPTAPWQHLNERPAVELNFMLAGNLRQSQSGLLREHRYTPGYHNWLFNPQSQEQNQLLGTGGFRLVSLLVAPTRMVQLLTGYVPEMLAVAEQIDQGRPFVRHASAPGLPPRLSYLLDTLWDSPEPLGLKRLHFEAVTLEVLSQQCALWLPAHSPAKLPLGAVERDKLLYARDLLLRQFLEPPSLAELARRCQLNEFALKRGFRQVFGSSVGSFVQEQRLEAARSLLQGGGKTVAEVAYHLGYAHPQHFHRAFKKRYGLTPKQLTR